MELMSKNHFLIHNGVALAIVTILLIIDAMLQIGVSIGILPVMIYIHYITTYRLMSVDVKPSWMFISFTGVGWIFLFALGLKESVIENNKILNKYNTKGKRIMITTVTFVTVFIIFPLIMFGVMFGMLQFFINGLF